MPTWLLVLLAMGPVLWLAFCVLKAQFGLECGWACGATVLLLDVTALSWLFFHGHRVMNGPQVAFLIICLVTMNTGLGVGWLTGHLARKRAQAATRTGSSAAAR